MVKYIQHKSGMYFIITHIFIMKINTMFRMLAAMMTVAVMAVATVVSVAPINTFAQVSGSQCVSITSNMRTGISDVYANGDVSLLQSYLRAAGYLDSTPTGYFGARTRAAVIALQTENGLPAAGIVGPSTRTLIKNLSCGMSYTTQNNVNTSYNGVTKTGCTSGEKYNIFTGQPCASATGATNVIPSPVGVIEPVANLAALRTLAKVTLSVQYKKTHCPHGYTEEGEECIIPSDQYDRLQLGERQASISRK
jgi:hypothetical protein